MIGRGFIFTSIFVWINTISHLILFKCGAIWADCSYLPHLIDIFLEFFHFLQKTYSFFIIFLHFCHIFIDFYENFGPNQCILVHFNYERSIFILTILLKSIFSSFFSLLKHFSPDNCWTIFLFFEKNQKLASDFFTSNSWGKKKTLPTRRERWWLREIDLFNVGSLVCWGAFGNRNVVCHAWRDALVTKTKWFLNMFHGVFDASTANGWQHHHGIGDDELNYMLI